MFCALRLSKRRRRNRLWGRKISASSTGLLGDLRRQLALHSARILAVLWLAGVACSGSNGSVTPSASVVTGPWTVAQLLPNEADSSFQVWFRKTASERAAVVVFGQGEGVRRWDLLDGVDSSSSASGSFVLDTLIDQSTPYEGAALGCTWLRRSQAMTALLSCGDGPGVNEFAFWALPRALVTSVSSTVRIGGVDAECWQFEQPLNDTTGEICLRKADARPYRISLSNGPGRPEETYTGTKFVEGVVRQHPAIVLSGLTPGGPQTFEADVALAVLEIP